MSVRDGDVVGMPLLDDFLALWSEWRRAEDRVPDWARFRPFDHPHLLPHVMLYEQVEGRFRCAIVGEQAATSLPVRLAGRYIDEAMPAKNLADITRRLSGTLSTGTPNFVEKTMAWQPGRDLTSYCALQLPFAAPGKPRILSVMSFRSQRV